MPAQAHPADRAGRTSRSMHQSKAWRRAGAVACLWAATTICAAAQGTEPDAVEVNAAVTLARIQAAATKSDYAGVYIYQQGGSMQSSRLVHVVDGTGERERLEVLDGIPREYLRHNDTVRTLIPEKKAIIVEPGRSDRFPGLLLGEPDRLNAHYRVRRLMQKTRIAGYECDVLEVRPKDDFRYGYNLCIEPGSGLLLKEQTVAGDGEIVDQLSFSTLVLGKQVDASQLAPSWNIEGWKVFSKPTEPTDVAKAGWRLAPPPGFALVTQVERPMRTGRPVVRQLVYSDGLAAVSVFIETVNPKVEHGVPLGAIRNGSMSFYRARIGDHWVTALGEVPIGTLRLLVDRIEYVPKAVE